MSAVAEAVGIARPPGALVDIGGGYALAPSRKLWLVVEKCAPIDIEDPMRPLIGPPERIEAVRSAIERRQNGAAL